MFQLAFLQQVKAQADPAQAVQEDPPKNKIIERIAAKKAINFDAIPGNFTLAETHFLASRVGVQQEKKDNSKSSKSVKLEQPDVEQQNKKKNGICDCCARDIKTETLTMKSDLMELSYLGSGFPMLFYFLKLVIILLIILFCISGIYNSIANRNFGDVCQSNSSECKGNWITYTSLGNRMNSYTSIYVQECLNLASVCALILFIQLIIYVERTIDNDCDDAVVLASDYSIMVNNIQREIIVNEQDVKASNYLTESAKLDYDDELKDFFEKAENVNNEQLEVVKVNLGYNLSDLMKLEKSQDEITRKKKIIFKKQIKESKKIDTGCKEIKNLDRKIEDIQDEIKELEWGLRAGKGVEFMKERFAGVAFITFNTEAQQKRVLELAQKKKIKDFYGNQLRISAAPDPTEIFWDNLGVSNKSRVIRFIIGLFLDATMIFVSGVAIYFLSKYQHDYAASHDLDNITDQKEKTTQLRYIQLLAFTISLVISIINFLLQKLVKVVAEFKKLQTKTNYNLSFSFFLSLAQFTNCTLVPLIVQFIVQQNSVQQMLYGASGLIPNQNTIFMVNAFLPILFFIFDFGSIMKNYKRKKERNNKEISILTQQELLELFEDPAYAIEFEYSQIMKTLFMTLFYATPLPICVLWSIAGLVIQYLITKFNLITRRSTPFNMGSSLNYNTIQLLKIGLAIYACLSYVFIILSESDSSHESHSISFVAIIIAGVHVFLPIQIFNERFFQVIKKKPDNTKSYWQVQNQFSTDYDRVNPGTRHIANAIFIDEQERLANHTLFEKFLPKQLVTDIIAQFGPKMLDTIEISDSADKQKEEKQKIDPLIYVNEFFKNNKQASMNDDTYAENLDYISDLLEMKMEILNNEAKQNNTKLQEISRGLRKLQNTNIEYKHLKEKQKNDENKRLQNQLTGDANEKDGLVEKGESANYEMKASKNRVVFQHKRSSGENSPRTQKLSAILEKKSMDAVEKGFDNDDIAFILAYAQENQNQIELVGPRIGYKEMNQEKDKNGLYLKILNHTKNVLLKDDQESNYLIEINSAIQVLQKLNKNLSQKQTQEEEDQVLEGDQVYEEENFRTSLNENLGSVQLQMNEFQSKQNMILK